MNPSARWVLNRFGREFDMADDDQTANADEGADPSEDIQKQNRGETTTADQVSANDPHKVEKLAKAGEPQIDPDAGSD
jgi:hypothetical protein